MEKGPKLGPGAGTCTDQVCGGFKERQYPWGPDTSERDKEKSLGGMESSFVLQAELVQERVCACRMNAHCPVHLFFATIARPVKYLWGGEV